MVGIYKFENGAKFTGLIAKNEEEAWKYLDKEYGHEFGGRWYGANRNAFAIQEVQMIKIAKTVKVKCHKINKI